MIIYLEEVVCYEQKRVKKLAPPRKQWKRAKAILYVKRYASMEFIIVAWLGRNDSIWTVGIVWWSIFSSWMNIFWVAEDILDDQSHRWS